MPAVISGFDTSLVGISAFAQIFIDQVTGSIIQAFTVVFLLLFLSLLLRKDWLGILAGFLVLTALLVSPRIGQEYSIGLLVSVVANAAYVLCAVLCAVRIGPLALMVTLLFDALWFFFPITTELTAWYAGNFVLDLILLVALAIYGFYTSLAGQPLFGGSLLQED
jgi:hypothetical protein